MVLNKNRAKDAIYQENNPKIFFPIQVIYVPLLSQLTLGKRRKIN